MRIALFSDIHANREALSACLAHAGSSGIDRYVFLGDYVGYGADPAWVLDKVMQHVENGALALLGNHDVAVIGSTNDMTNDAASAIAWTRGQIDSTHRDFLRGLPLQAEEDERLYVHANPYAPDKWGYVLDPGTAARCFAATRARATFCGHVHIPRLYHTPDSRRVGEFVPTEGVEIPLSRGRRWLAVIGSVGQPRDRNPAACYAVLDDQRAALTYWRVPYDVESAARKITSAKLPIWLAQRLYEGR